MKQGLVIFVTGSPGAGKTTLCEALAACFERALRIPFDDLREWVVNGIATSMDWTDETERQFQIAEEAACAVAKCYSRSGFTVLVDHCRNPERLDAVVSTYLADTPVLKVCLAPTVDTALARNRARTNKTFDTKLLEPTIRYVTEHHFSHKARPGWLVIENNQLGVDPAVAMVVESARRLTKG